MNQKYLTLAVAAGALASSGAHAQSSVQLYGLIDLSALAYTTNADAAGKHVIGMGHAGEPWFSGSRWGVHGAEDIGGGNKIIFKLESEFVAANGQMEDPGQLFDRDSWVGVENATIGQVTAGFQDTVAKDFSGLYADPYVSAKFSTNEGAYTNSNNFKQMVFYAAGPTGTRSENGIQWRKLFSNGIYAAAGYQFSNSTQFANGSGYQAVLGWNVGPASIGGFYSHSNNGGFTDQTYSVGGDYRFGIGRVNAGYFHYTGKQGSLPDREDNAWTVSFKLAPKGPFDYELGYQQMRVKNAAYNSDGFIPNANSGAFDTTATTVHNGYKETIYASTFYHLSKRTEVYLAADYMKLHGGYTVSTTFGHNNQLEVATGIRTRF
ncbi:gram-negative porin family protein [Paraburkholderia fungorum]|uniref:Gram-negative porin family protein n=1 Tax=Paraburkholderia fungorum TaxID=134537 RepID=A0AAU8STQ5_9BURK|nr:porin [Paraburkholderia fungorum]AJZ57137.1 gram-negative porin family protein [Paraburkholderia fungorum]PRZ45690.1 putative porin [Paraburkholderia fungorum]